MLTVLLKLITALSWLGLQRFLASMLAFQDPEVLQTAEFAGCVPELHWDCGKDASDIDFERAFVV